MKGVRSVGSTRLCAGLVSLLGAACASGSGLDDTQVRETYSSVRAAETVGAEEVPKASLHLELAREQIDEAEALIRQGKSKRARRVLARARADAELAMTLTRARLASRQAEAAQQRLAELEREGTPAPQAPPQQEGNEP